MSAVRRLPAVTLCGEVRLVAGKRFICILPEHDWFGRSADSVVAYRRRHGIVSAPDKHIFVKEEE